MANYLLIQCIMMSNAIISPMRQARGIDVAQGTVTPRVLNSARRTHWSLRAVHEGNVSSFLNKKLLYAKSGSPVRVG